LRVGFPWCSAGRKKEAPPKVERERRGLVDLPLQDCTVCDRAEQLYQAEPALQAATPEIQDGAPM